MINVAHRIANLLVFYFLFCQFGFSQECGEGQYFMTQAVDPSNEETFWHMNNDEVQGVANDGSNWFITTAHLAGNTSTSHDNGTIWKIPLSVDLGDNSTTNTSVLHISENDIPELSAHNFAHFGDADCYRYNNIDYVIVPTYNNQDDINEGIIACFRADDLSFVNYASTGVFEAGFCFVDNSGNIYIKRNNYSFRRYIVNWEELTNENSNNHDLLSNPCVITIDLTEAPFDTIRKAWQGAELSDNGDWLYLSSGRAKSLEDSSDPSDGLHIFEVQNYDCGATWKWYEYSKNENSSSIPFTFLFENSNGVDGQQPQGLTYWNIDNPNVPNKVRGKVHVMMFDFELFTGNNVYFYHFSDYIHVDGQNGLIEPERRIGGIIKPFKYFNDAFFHYPAWNGSTIVLKAGAYNETGIYDECVKLTSEGGSAIIGANE